MTNVAATTLAEMRQLTVQKRGGEHFLDRLKRIKIEELFSILESKLIDTNFAAARFRALSLAVSPTTTDRQIYDALIEYDCRPEIVSVVKEIGKSYVIETIEILKKWEISDIYRYDRALYSAAAKGNVDVMKLLKELGASDYFWPLVYAAGGGHIAAMKLLKSWGAPTGYADALVIATRNNRKEAVNLLETWGVGRSRDEKAYRRK